MTQPEKKARRFDIVPEKHHRGKAERAFLRASSEKTPALDRLSSAKMALEHLAAMVDESAQQAFEEGKNGPEVAQALGVSRQAVWSRWKMFKGHKG